MKQNDLLLNLITQEERELDAYILIKGKRYGASDLLKSFKLNDKAHIDGNWIGQVIPKQLDFTLINNGIQLKQGDEVRLYHGAKNTNGSFVYQNLGNYYIDSFVLKEDSKTVAVTCFDILKKLQDTKIYLTYPVTVAGLISKVSAISKVSIDDTNVLFKSFNIQKEIYFGKDKTATDILRAIAGVSLCFVTVDENNVIKFKRLTNTNKEINLKNVFKLKVGGNQLRYNTVVISRSPQEDNVYSRDEADVSTNGVIELKLANNPILDLNREAFARQLLTLVKQIEYSALDDFNLQSNPLIETGDYYLVDGKRIAILEHTITLTRSDVKSPLSKNNTTDFTKAKGIGNAVIETELYVDKVKNEIVSRIGDEVGNKVVELGLTQDGITQTVRDYVTNHKSELKGDKGDTGATGARGPQGQKGDKGEPGTPADTTILTRHESQINQMANEITSKVSATTYTQDKTQINSKISQIEQKANSIELSVQSKGSIRNLITNADGFYYHSSYRYIGKFANNDWILSEGSGRIQFRESDNSFMMYTTWGGGDYHFNIPIEATKKVDRYTVFLNAWKSERISKIRVGIIDKSGKLYTGRHEIDINGTAILGKRTDVADIATETEELAYLRIIITSNANDNSTQGFRIYPERIALVEGIYHNLTWDMTYLSSNNALLALTENSFNVRVGQAEIKIDTTKNDLLREINNITLSGNKITLNGDTNVSGSFKIDANNLAEIGGFRITNSVLESGTGSSYFRLSGTSGSASILAGGETWDSAKFAVSSTGTLKAINGDFEGKINATSGEIGGFNIKSSVLESGTGSNYIRLSGASGYTKILIGGETWDSAKFAVSSTGVLKATGVTITGTGHFSSGQVGGTTITQNGLSGGSFSNGSFTYGSFSGESYGYGSFNSGNYVGNGHLSSGTTIAGHSLTNDSDGRLKILNFSASYINAYEISLGLGIRSTFDETPVRWAYFTNTGWKITNSDIRLKDNIHDMTNDTVNELYTMPLIEYTYKSDKDKIKNYGINANLLYKTLSNDFANSFIFKDENSGLYGAKYEMLTPHLVKAVQDLNKRLERLENE